MDTADLDRELESHSLSGFWKTRVPAHLPERPYLWKWQHAHAGLMRAKDEIGIELAERRSIRLVNPHAPIKSTSRTLQASFSLVNPGEVARAHRHSMAAIRFVVQGGGACTIVEGERFYMEPGDLILTPNWTWHDHFNGSDEPIIWMDGLDGPMIQNFNVLFHDEYEREKQDVVRRDGEAAQRLGFARSPGEEGPTEPLRGVPFRYAWKDTYEVLKGMRQDEMNPHDGRLLRYINPVTGGYTLPTMSCEIQMLDPGFKSKTHRHTSTSLYHVFKGKGRTAVGEEYLEWEKGDSFVIPNWHWHYHENAGRDEAVLFTMNDRPVIEALQWYREEEEG